MKTCRAGDTVDVSGVVAEKDTAEGGEGAEQVGLPGDGSLDHLDVLGGGHGTVGAAPQRGRRRWPHARCRCCLSP